MTQTLDRRLNAVREDRADSRLREVLSAREFVAGRPAAIAVAVADFRDAPSDGSECISQGLFGEPVSVFEDRDGWSWVQSAIDGYVGYVRSQTLASGMSEATHRVVAQRTYRYAGPDLKMPVSGALSVGSRVAVAGQAETRDLAYALLDDGSAVVAGHLRPLAESEPDYVEAATRFLHAPYLWGGRSGFGVDCSGLVQLAMMMAGRSILRDTDMQAETVGTLLGQGSKVPDLERGDLVFWKGHVAIMTDRYTMLHASGRSMTVTLEPLKQAIDRIALSYGLPTAYRRP